MEKGLRWREGKLEQGRHVIGSIEDEISSVLGLKLAISSDPDMCVRWVNSIKLDF